MEAESHRLSSGVVDSFFYTSLVLLAEYDPTPFHIFISILPLSFRAAIHRILEHGPVIRRLSKSVETIRAKSAQI